MWGLGIVLRLFQAWKQVPLPPKTPQQPELSFDIVLLDSNSIIISNTLFEWDTSDF